VGVDRGSSREGRRRGREGGRVTEEGKCQIANYFPKSAENNSCRKKYKVPKC